MSQAEGQGELASNQGSVADDRGGVRAATSAHDARPALTSGRMPDFFIAGHQKCGTTALYLMLSEHPQIFMPEFKEPRYFAPELRPPLENETPDRPQKLESYLALFADARPDQRAGEASPQYLRSPTAAARIAELQPDARMIVILREPAAFLRSFHMQMVASHVETEKDFRKAIGLEQSRREQASREFVPPQLLYSEHVHYAEQMRRLHAAFPSEQVLVLTYDEFRASNEVTVRKVQRFLDVDDTVPLQPVETKPLDSVRSMRLHELGHAVRYAKANPASAGVVSRTVATLVPKRVRGGAVSKVFHRVAYSSPQSADGRFMLELRRRFKGEVNAISDDLDLDLISLWGYDKLA
jgi:hypothetical protein